MKGKAALILGLALLAWPTATSPGQASDHDRLGVEGEARNRLEAAIGGSWLASGQEQGGDAEVGHVVDKPFSRLRGDLVRAVAGVRPRVAMGAG